MDIPQWLRNFIPSPRDMVSELAYDLLKAGAIVLVLVLLDVVNLPGMPSLDTIGWYIVIFAVLFIAFVQVRAHPSVPKTASQIQLDPPVPPERITSGVNGQPFIGGTDISIDIPNFAFTDSIFSQEKVTVVGWRFTLKQGRRVIVKDKRGLVYADNRGRLTISRQESKRWKDGYAVMQTTAVLSDGREVVLPTYYLKVAQKLS